MGFRQKWQLEDQRWITDGNFKITATDCPYYTLKISLASYDILPCNA